MIFDDLTSSDSGAFYSPTNDADYCIYGTSAEEKKFFDKVLGLRESISDDMEFSAKDVLVKEEDQMVPSKLSECDPFSSMSSPGSVLGGDGPEPSYNHLQEPPPSYEEHKVFSKLPPQSLSYEDLAARWRDIQDIISRESPTHRSSKIRDISKTVDSSEVNSSIAQSPAWYSKTVQESSFYSMSPESNSFVPPPRSSNSPPDSFAPSYNSYSSSPSSSTNGFDSSSRCSPSPHLKQNNTNKNTSNNCSNSTTINASAGEKSGTICGYTFQQLKSYIPESGHIQLWQFLIQLLCEPFNEDCIRWEGTNGSFTIVNQNELARRWGERKRRKHMTYEKLSRAIRYYYDKNYVKKIHGKKATYVFNFDELFKAQSRPSQQKSKESQDSIDMGRSIKIHPYQESSSSSASSTPPSSSYLPCAQNSARGNTQSVTGANCTPEMTSFVYNRPQQAKKIKVEYEEYGSRPPCYYAQEVEYKPISYTPNVSPFFDEDNCLSYY